ncbi:macro domain-like protein [Hesseltinella vesiculosa]|uniref:Macro domain-like protein n=1 Tax=Hesseltinella vesiculosa TaxID=101127 RepID=A0A1X2GHN3_9FUNG|nr:macro domain-like protein [Hesseltinella vesiculosa]
MGIMYQSPPHTFGSHLISVVQDDITKLHVDAIVDSTNRSMGGANGTLSGIIHRAAGPRLKRDLGTRKTLEYGDAIVTPGYNLPANAIVHTAIPHSSMGTHVLSNCYANSLRELVAFGYHTIAFPCMGTGNQGFDRHMAANTAMSSVKNFLEQNDRPGHVHKVIFCTHSTEEYNIYKNLLPQYFCGYHTTD